MMKRLDGLPPSPQFPPPTLGFYYTLYSPMTLMINGAKRPPNLGGVLLVSHYVGSLPAFPQLSITWLTTPIAFITEFSIIW